MSLPALVAHIASTAHMQHLHAVTRHGACNLLFVSCDLESQHGSGGAMAFRDAIPYPDPSGILWSIWGGPPARPVCVQRGHLLVQTACSSRRCASTGGLGFHIMVWPEPQAPDVGRSFLNVAVWVITV